MVGKYKNNYQYNNNAKQGNKQATHSPGWKSPPPPGPPPANSQKQGANAIFEDAPEAPDSSVTLVDLAAVRAALE